MPDHGAPGVTEGVTSEFGTQGTTVPPGVSKCPRWWPLMEAVRNGVMERDISPEQSIADIDWQRMLSRTSLTRGCDDSWQRRPRTRSRTRWRAPRRRPRRR
jgi:hypothetical protein